MIEPVLRPVLGTVADGGGAVDATAIGFSLVYATVAVGLVVYLALTLQRNGAVFLEDVFDDAELAAPVNRLLVIGFYLFNLGYALLLFQLPPDHPGLIEAFNELMSRLGVLLLSLGVLHLVNMAVFWRFRSNRTRPRRFEPPASPPPPPPARSVWAPPGAGAPPSVERVAVGDGPGPGPNHRI